MARSARLVVRVVHVPAGPGAADARRRVADVLLRAAASGAAQPDAPEPPNETPEPSRPSGAPAA